MYAAISASPATVGFLWFSAHAGLLSSTLVFFALRRAEAGDPAVPRRAQAFIVAAAVVYVALTSGAIWIDGLPPAFEHGRWTPFFLGFMAPVVSALAVAVIVVTVRRGDHATVLDLWLGVIALALIAGLAIAVAGRARFTVGWYASLAMIAAVNIALLGTLLRQAAMRYVALVQRAHVLENEAHTDTLTGLPNRRRFDEEFARAFGSALRRDGALAVAIADIDRLKAYNDAFGHQAGDEALHAIGKAIADSVGRSGDFAARYGGEEFVVILEDTLLDGATGVAERIRAAVLAADLKAPAGGPLTVSVGVAARRPGESAEDVLRHADEALYEAKNAGRNRVRVLAPLTG